MEAETIHDQQALAEQLAQARETLETLARDLRAVEDELEGLTAERTQHRLLADVCRSLDELDEIGAAQLFWGEDTPADIRARQMLRVRGRVDAFNARIREIEDRRRDLFEELKQQQEQAGLFEDELFEAQDAEERLNQEWIIERAISELPARKMVMLWTRGGEDDRRFRKALSTILVVCLLFAMVVPMIDIPLPAPDEAMPEVPERVVRLMMEARPQPPPPPPREEPKPKPEEKLAEQKPVPQRTVVPEKVVPEPEQAAPVETPEQGILAFRDKLAAIEQDQVVAQLGSQAHINDGDGATGQPERAMLTTNAPGSSGGINLASLSRGVGGSGGKGGMAGVAVTRATSTIGGIGTPGGARPLGGDGAANSRTDEEIQIVFDRYKAALYRLYNRELRKDPTLRGQMILHLTIEADGTVSMCELQASDMNAPELSAQVVERVRTINFGAKEDISAITIFYPIDFLPAA
jgi:hypothetical protein